MEVEIVREAARVGMVDGKRLLGGQFSSDTPSISSVTHLD
jgi:hypothetical protein